MPATEPRTFISDPLQKAVDTGIDTDAPVHRDFAREDFGTNGWDAVEGQLIEWGCDPSQLDDDETETPSRERITCAIQLATKLSRRGLPPPTRVVPDAHGGVVFELQGIRQFETIHIQADGRIEYRVFVNHRLVLREPWDLHTIDNE